MPEIDHKNPSQYSGMQFSNTHEQVILSFMVYRKAKHAPQVCQSPSQIHNKPAETRNQSLEYKEHNSQNNHVDLPLPTHSSMHERKLTGWSEGNTILTSVLFSSSSSLNGS